MGLRPRLVQRHFEIGMFQDLRSRRSFCRIPTHHGLGIRHVREYASILREAETGASMMLMPSELD